MAQRKYTRFACNECHQRAEQLESADKLVVKFRCNTCMKQWEFHIDEKGFLGILTGGLQATAGGISAAILAGLIVSLLFKAKDKA